MLIGITGYKGRLGAQLVGMPYCAPFDCDITSKESIQAALDALHPEVIINCASYTKVDEAETHQDECIRVNHRGVGYLRNMFDGKIIHISTDYVFDGKSGPYDEVKSTMSPLNMYGWSKLGAEVVCQNLRKDTNTVIVRTTGLYGGISGRPDFARSVIRSLTDKKEMFVSQELKGNQSYIPHIARAIHKLASMSVPSGIVHIASRDVVSRYQFALTLARALKLDTRMLIPCVNSAIDTWKAVRPSEGGLKIKKSDSLQLPIYWISDGVAALKDAVENGEYSF